jgi:aminomethyltransferase
MTKRTPLYDAHVALGAKMAPFGGWEMPIEYEGIVKEHHHTRAAATVFDICHMGEFELSGATAERDLERLLTQRISTIAIGQCRYGYLLREDGGVLDDLTCYRLGPDRFMLVVNAATTDSDRAWITARLSPATHFRDISEETAKLDIQGPLSRFAMENALGERLPDLKYFRFAPVTLKSVPCLLSRTGYTGEWGYELYLPPSAVADFWEILLKNADIQPAGLGARDTLRLEVGYPLYGHELSAERSPVATSRGQFVDMTKDFIGKAAVARDLQQGCSQYLWGLTLETRRAARAGDTVWDGSRCIGHVTSGSIAPSLGVAVALAFLNADAAQERRRVEVETHGKRLAATVTTPPFYRQGTARAATDPRQRLAADTPRTTGTANAPS